MYHGISLRALTKSHLYGVKDGTTHLIMKWLTGFTRFSTQLKKSKKEYIFIKLGYESLKPIMGSLPGFLACRKPAATLGSLMKGPQDEACQQLRKGT